MVWKVVCIFVWGNLGLWKDVAWNTEPEYGVRSCVYFVCRGQLWFWKDVRVGQLDKYLVDDHTYCWGGGGRNWWCSISIWFGSTNISFSLARLVPFLFNTSTSIVAVVGGIGFQCMPAFMIIGFVLKLLAYLWDFDWRGRVTIRALWGAAADAASCNNNHLVCSLLSNHPKQLLCPLCDQVCPCSNQKPMGFKVQKPWIKLSTLAKGRGWKRSKCYVVHTPLSVRNVMGPKKGQYLS